MYNEGKRCNDCTWGLWIRDSTEGKALKNFGRVATLVEL